MIKIWWISLFLVPLSPKHNIYGGTITRLWFVVGRNGTAIGESAGKPNGKFSSQHIHDSLPMKERGIHCVMDQDREMRQTNKWAVKEKIN